MVATRQTGGSGNEVTGGFGTVDDKGRISLSRSMRNALGIGPGSSVAYVVLNSAVLVVPWDEQLAALMRQAEQALSSAGLTAQDLLDELPAARAAVVSESYGSEFLREIQRLDEERRKADGIPE